VVAVLVTLKPDSTLNVKTLNFYYILIDMKTTIGLIYFIKRVYWPSREESGVRIGLECALTHFHSLKTGI